MIAQRAEAGEVCLHLIGHASPSGPTELNDRLSLARANRIRQDLVEIEPRLRGRITTEGVGSRDSIVGTGRDDATDLADRRVDFEMQPCARVALLRSESGSLQECIAARRVTPLLRILRNQRRPVGSKIRRLSNLSSTWSTPASW